MTRLFGMEDDFGEDAILGRLEGMKDVIEQVNKQFKDPVSCPMLGRAFYVITYYSRIIEILSNHQVLNLYIDIRYVIVVQTIW